MNRKNDFGYILWVQHLEVRVVTMSFDRILDSCPGSASTSRGEGEPMARRAYTPPRIYREPLEAMAAVCAPTPPAKSNPGFCPQGPISS